MKKFYTAEEVEMGKLEGISPGLFTKQLLQSLRARRKICYTKIGGRCYYTKEDIDNYINANTIKTA